MKIFEKFYSYLTPKNIKYFSLASIFISFLFLSDSAFADWAEKTAWETDPIVGFFSGLIKIVTVLLSIATVLVSALMSPEWTTWSVLGLDKPLKDLWYLISNIVYFLFSLIFIYIAIMNIIWKWGDYELKSALPRFIVWLLIVPFSWFIVQFVISISWVLTVAVLSIPYDTFKNTNILWDAKTIMVPVCKNTQISFENKQVTTDNINDFVSCSWDKEVTLEELLNPKNSTNIFWIINIYTYWVMKIDQNAKIFNEDILKWTSNVANIALKLWFDGIFILVYLLLLIALMMALFVRWFWMWMFAMFSPLFWLLHFFKKWWTGVGKETKNFNFTQLIKLALMPVYVAGALSFWLLFLLVAWKWISQDSNTSLQFTNSWSTIGNWEFSLSIWKPMTNSTASFIKWFQWTIWTLILQFLWIAILWVAVITALWSSDITKTVVTPFETMWSNIGNLIKNAPTYTPIIPTSEWFQSIKWIEKLTTTIESLPSQMNNKRIQPLQNKLQQIVNIETVSFEDKNRLNELLHDWIKEWELDEVRRIYLTAVEKFWHQNKDVMTIREQIADSVKKSPSYIKTVTTGLNVNFSNISWDLNNADFNKLILWTPNPADTSNLANSMAPWVIKASDYITTKEQQQPQQQSNWVKVWDVNINDFSSLRSNKDSIIKDFLTLNESDKERLLEIYNNWVPSEEEKATMNDLLEKIRKIK